ncbi:oligosaccharide flippase family protein [Alteromonadaceae bacterium BrNp21-10]|nr:oligosaccharide flippase family protein [Alteromonadaceae bacterium BrNp21-10]
MQDNHTTDAEKVLAGSFWLISLSWFNRIIGFCSIFILARLLSPQDFGSVAIILIAIQLAETLSDVGSEQYYIQLESATPEDLDSAWTFNILVKLGISVCLLLLSPIIVEQFDIPQLLTALLVMSFIPFLSATANGYIFELKKQMHFRSFFAFSAIAKFMGGAASLVIAYIYQSYWAILFGILLSTLSYSVLSYIMLPNRAHWKVNNCFKQVQFSKWMILRSIVGHGRAKFDVWFASSLQGLSGLGGYNLAKDLVLLPSREFIGPITQVLFSSFAKSNNSSTQQTHQIYMSLAGLFSLCIPITTGLMLIAPDLVAVLLGSHWLPYTKTIELLSPLVCTFAIGNFYSAVFTAQGKVKQLFIFDAVTFISSILVVLLLFYRIENINQLALTRSVLGIIIVLAGISWLSNQCGLSLTRIVKMLVWPLLCSTAMYFIVLTLPLNSSIIVLNLMYNVMLGGIVYGALFLIGCKLHLLGGPESNFINGLTNQLLCKFINKIRPN